MDRSIRPGAERVTVIGAGLAGPACAVRLHESGVPVRVLEAADQVVSELVDWFGEQVRGWRHLRTEHIPRALPVDPPGHRASFPGDGPIHLCGDHTSSGSIEGAIRSGLRVADQVISPP